MARLAPWLLVIVLAGCTTPLIVGEECTDSSDCEDGLSCFFSESTMTIARCMQDCDDTSTRLCAGGEVCIPAASMGVPREAEVCFLGGTAAVGAPCENLFDCVAGSICVVVGTEQACFNACVAGADPSTCPSTDTCEPLMGMGTNGYCAPIATP